MDRNVDMNGKDLAISAQQQANRTNTIILKGGLGMSRNNVALRIFALVCFVLLLWVGCASATTLVVNQTSPACVKGDFYCDTIQESVDMANEGDTIIVCPGTYVENILVDKSLTIRSENGSDSTIVRAKNSNDHAFKVTADYVNISGFTVEGATGGFSGISLYYADYCDISNNNCSNNRDGIFLLDSNNNNISNNNCSNNGDDGIYIHYSNNNNISNNNCSNNDDGIHLWDSNNNKLTGNIMLENGIDIWGDSLSDYTHEIDESNTVNGKPVYYWKDVEEGRIPDGAGQVILVNCTNIAIENQNLNNASFGVQIAFSSFIIVKSNNCSNNGGGISLRDSNSNSILNNNCSKNWDGISLRDSNSNSVSNNNCSSNNGSGISLEDSNSNSVSNNNCSSNDGSGISLGDSNNNTIEEATPLIRINMLELN